jgi:hypothetical protein
VLDSLLAPSQRWALGVRGSGFGVGGSGLEVRGSGWGFGVGVSGFGNE